MRSCTITFPNKIVLHFLIYRTYVGTVVNGPENIHTYKYIIHIHIYIYIYIYIRDKNNYYCIDLSTDIRTYIHIYCTLLVIFIFTYVHL